MICHSGFTKTPKRVPGGSEDPVKAKNRKSCRIPNA
jgi:hypothetical protein